MSKLLFLFGGFVWSGTRVSKIGSKSLTLIQDMFMNNNNSINLEVLHERYSEAVNLGRAGFMKESISARIDILNDIYSHCGISPSDMNYYPPFLHPNWIEWFGHQSMIFALKFGQDFDIIPKGQRYATSFEFENDNASSYKAKNLMDLVKSENSNWMKKISLKDFVGLSDVKPLNHIFENSEIVRTKGDFLEIHSFFNLICSRLRSSNQSLTFHSEYNFRSLEILNSMFPNFSDFESFAVVHLRESKTLNDSKRVKFENYDLAINEFIKNGISVIRLGMGSGNGKITPLVPRYGLFDLALYDSRLHQSLHPFLLSRAKTVVTTHSGVHVLPSLAQVPVIFTNCIAPGMSVLDRSPGSLSIPKKFMKRGKYLSLEQIFNSNLSYAELNLDEFRKIDVELEENSALEILSAVQQTLLELDNQTFQPSPIGNLMFNYQTLANGRIPNSYFEFNPWFYNEN
jgi:putative glycosyltransferase (TIGR04372 family)